MRTNYVKSHSCGLLSIYLLLLFSLITLGSAKRIEVLDYLTAERAKVGSTGLIRMAGMGSKDLYNVDLSKLDLRDVDFTGCKLGHVNFSRSMLQGATFKGVDLYRTDFSHTILYGLDFTGCDLREANFDHANLTGSVGFGEVSFGFVSAKLANLTGLNLSQKDLSSIDFTGANLSQCDLRFSRLRWKQGLILNRAILKDTLLLEVSDSEQSRIFNTAGAITTHSGLASSLRSGVSYKHINFRNIRFQNLNLSGVDFSEYQIRFSHFIDCDLSDVRFYKAKLIGANFKNCDLQRANFTMAECDGVDFGNSNLDCASFTDASIHNARFTDVMGETNPSVDKLADLSDYQWNKFWFRVEKFLEAIFPVAWMLTILFYIIFWLRYKKTMETWLHTVGALTLFVYSIGIITLLARSLDVMMVVLMLSLVFIALELVLSICLIISHSIKGNFVAVVKSNKHSIAFLCCNIFMLFWLIFFAGLVMASAG